MPSYDPTFNPPAPCLNVEVSAPDTPNQWTDLRGKLDTGADLCVVPEYLVAGLQLTPVRPIQARGYDGRWVSRMSYLINLQVEDYHVENIEAVSSAREDILIGRNVLNQFFITLDGRGLAFEIEDR